MMGVSVTVTHLDDELLGFLQLPARSVGLVTVSGPREADGRGAELLRRAVIAAALALEDAEDELCRLDSVAGDGDEGLGMARAAEVPANGSAPGQCSRFPRLWSWSGAIVCHRRSDGRRLLCCPQCHTRGLEGRGSGPFTAGRLAGDPGGGRGCPF